MATFGRTDASGATWHWLDKDKNILGSFSVPDGGLVTKLTANMKGLGGSGNQVHKGFIYSDDSVNADVLLGVTEEIAVAYDAAAAWVDLTFVSSISLGPGTYWLGLISGDNDGITGIGLVSGTGLYAVGPDTYSDGPDNPFPYAYSPGVTELCIYATYTPNITGTGAIQTAGLAIGGTGHMDITGTGAVQAAGVALGGTGFLRCTGTGALTIASPALSGRTWMDSAHLRQLGGKAMLWGAKGRAEIWGLKGKASM